MKALTYIEHGKFALLDKPKPEILDPWDAVVRVTLGSICTSNLHIEHSYAANCTNPNEGWALGCRIEAGKIDTTPLITHRYKLEDIEAAYYLFENKLDGVVKVAVEP